MKPKRITSSSRLRKKKSTRRLPAAVSHPAGIDLQSSCDLGTALTFYQNWSLAIADLVLADPPFGIGANDGGFRQRTIHHHNYEDTPEVARSVAQSIILYGFRVAKPMANMFIFCDIDLFPWLKDTAARAGWTPFRTPIVW